ncbi:MAG: hypothetical protein RLZZ530_3 [Pseudomonadota bacterium]|jgi:hypothetical protein
MTQKKISKNDYAVFILTHGRPDKVITYDTLINCGYTGQIYIIIDNEDKFKNEYYKKFGSKVIEFSKSDYKGKFDIMDNFNNNKVIVYARNACYDIARKLNLKFFFEYEDDYTSFLYRYIKNDQLKGITVRDLDKVLELMINCLINTKSDTIAFSQGGDFIGGAGSFKSNSFKRKAMNSFLFKVNEDPKNDIIFVGRMNDDVNTYLSKGKVGKLFFQISNINLNQLQTQSNSGGNTEIYQQFGTYSKSFYSVMIEPSCVKINLMGNIHKRLHHTIKWENAVPKIISEELKK